MKRKIYYVLGLVIALNILSSCTKGKQEDARPMENECWIYLKNQEGLNLIGTSGQRYHPDSIGVGVTPQRAPYKEHGRAWKDKNNEYCFYVNYSCCMDGANFYARLKNGEIDTVRVKAFDGGLVNFYYNSQLKLSTNENLFHFTPSFTNIK